MKEIRLRWYEKVFYKFFPCLFIKKFLKERGVENSIFDKLHEIFVKVKRIDIIPLHSGTRGFMLILDRKTALYFYQDSDHFIYDGFEIGKYDKGDVTIFDSIK